MNRDLDIVLFGATGDTGVVGCCYLYFNGKKLGITSWAPAARNLGKLKTDVLDRFVVACGPTGIPPAEPIQADADDYQSLVKMCARTKCVLACAGPFSQYGESVVRACVEVGTNYVDITGEIPWVEKMQRKYGQEAEEKGISIVNCSGYDSVPPDLTTYLAAKALEKEGDRLLRFEAFVGCSGGALPTGTLNTVLHAVDQGKTQALRTLTFGLLGSKAKAKQAQRGGDSPDVRLLGSSSSKALKFVPESEQSNLKRNLFWTMCPGYSSLAGQFCLPHFMAPTNIHAVHQTAAKEGYDGLQYRERQAGLPSGAFSLFGLLPTLLAICGAPLIFLFLALPGSSKLALKLRDGINSPLQKKVRNMAFNHFAPTGKTVVHGYGVSQNGRRVAVNMHCTYDSGLGFTMLSACNVAALLAQSESGPKKAKVGFNSPVVALGGDALAGALRESGVTLEVIVSGGSRL